MSFPTSKTKLEEEYTNVQKSVRQGALIYTFTKKMESIYVGQVTTNHG
jgi:hypothetical protein